jgi:hypothetical protein
LTIQKFTYKGTPREVVITEENEESIKGFDISHLDKEDVKEAWRVKTQAIDMSKLTEAEQKEEYEKMRELMATFRHFKRSLIQG